MCRKIVLKIITTIFCIQWLVITAGANIKLPRFISNGMVLQRDVPIAIWGFADVGEKVEVSFTGEAYTAITDNTGKWRITIKKHAAGGPYNMQLKGSNEINIKNILIGDVWICSGQSNMEYEMYKAAEKYPTVIANSSNDMIRQFDIEKATAFNSNADVVSLDGWQPANHKNVLNFTAVGYFFAKRLWETHKIPVGLINCSYGGTPVEGWLNENLLIDFPSIYKNAILYKDPVMVQNLINKDKQRADAWNQLVSQKDIGLVQNWHSNANLFKSWSSVEMPDNYNEREKNDTLGGVIWLKKQFTIPASLKGKWAKLRLGNIIGKDITYVNGIKVGTTSSKYPPRVYALDAGLLKEGVNEITVRIINEIGTGGFVKDKPYMLQFEDTSIDLKGTWKYAMGFSSVSTGLKEESVRLQDLGGALYHGMLEPIIGYTMKGVIWYQGESNVSRAEQYNTLFTRLINSWRKEWNTGDFPFLFVQLANKNLPKALPAESKLAELREAQLLALKLPNTGMAVASDIGEWNDVHPMNKEDVGTRLYLSAEKIAYGNKGIVHSGPIYDSMTKDGNKIILHFSSVGSGLVAKDLNNGHGTDLGGFAISGTDKKFSWAKAMISGNRVIVSNELVTNPVAVRYAWADNPETANLYNKEGLPASCFRTDKK